MEKTTIMDRQAHWCKFADVMAQLKYEHYIAAFWSSYRANIMVFFDKPTYYSVFKKPKKPVGFPYSLKSHREKRIKGF